MAGKKNYFPPQVGNIPGEVGKNSTRKSGTIVLGTVVMLHRGFKRDPASWGGAYRVPTIPQGLKSEICTCGFPTIVSLSPILNRAQIPHKSSTKPNFLISKFRHVIEKEWC